MDVYWLIHHCQDLRFDTLIMALSPFMNPLSIENPFRYLKDLTLVSSYLCPLENLGGVED